MLDHGYVLILMNEVVAGGLSMPPPHSSTLLHTCQASLGLEEQP